MLLGTDISHWEDDPSTVKEINFDIMAAAGARFCYFKATQGTKLLDRVFQISWADAKGKLFRGAYHYLDWSAPAIEQAIFFVNSIKDDPGELPPVVDFECRTNIPSGTTSQLWNFITYVEQHIGKAPLIYTSPDYWKNYGSTNIGWQRFPLWIANYYVVKPYVPLPWTTYRFWQYTDKGNGLLYGVEALQVDLNWFNGNEQDLAVLCGTPVPPTLEQRVKKLEEEALKHGWTL